jgi:hypothetical protein
MDGNHRVAASHRLTWNFEKKRSPGFGPLPLLSCVAGREQRLEQVALRDDVKASPGNRIQDGRIMLASYLRCLPVQEWWLATGDSRSSRVQCRIRSPVSAASGASALSRSAIWPTVNGIGRGFVSDSG